MRYVPKLSLGQSCAIVPNHSRDPDGYVYVGPCELHKQGWDREVFISAKAIRNMAQEIGMVDAEPKAEATAELERLRSAVKALKAKGAIA